MVKFEVVESWIYRHKNGQAFSIHGALPWRNETEKENFKEEMVGYTVHNPLTGQNGVGRMPWKTREEAQAYADKYRPSRISIGD